MRIIKATTIREMARDHPQVEMALLRWLRIAKEARWRHLAEVRTAFRAADEVKVASGRTVVVFNIGGNKYRLIAAIHYNMGKLYVLGLMTHREYSLDRWKESL
ncbi:MAG: type II toxin-antitoxin system HigB family toxin [Phycisphaerae bacterium]